MKTNYVSIQVFLLVIIINKASSARSANDEALVVQTGSEVGIYYGDCIEAKMDWGRVIDPALTR